MPIDNYDLLAPNTPAAWLALANFDGTDCVLKGAVGYVEKISATPFTDDFFRGQERKLAFGCKFQFTLDAPSLPIVHYYGIPIYNSACLTARKNWFCRYKDILEKHLADPRPARPITYLQGPLIDPFCSYTGNARGPFPWPRNNHLPHCLICKKPLAFMGVLDFRGFDELKQICLPGKAMVIHGCACAFGDLGTYALNWLNDDEDITIVGGQLGNEVELGTHWRSLDFPTVANYPDELAAQGLFLQERSIYWNFACYCPKIAGHAFWIQGDQTPNDRNGHPMVFIGQFFGTTEVEIGDSGIGYLFYSPEMRQTELVVQYY